MDMKETQNIFPLFPLYRLCLVHILLCAEVEESTRLLHSVHADATFVTSPPAFFCVVRLCLSITVRKRRRNPQFLGHCHKLTSRYHFVKKLIEPFYTRLRRKRELCSTASNNGFLLPELADWRSHAHPHLYISLLFSFLVFLCLRL